MSRQQTIEVLLIEDDPMVQEVNRQFIERVEHFQVVDIAANGEEGVRLAKERTPHLIILDIYMPEKDGQKTLKEIRKEGLDVDIIVVTAANDKATIRKMLQNGAVDYIVKPFKFERLQKALENYLHYLNDINGKGELGQQQIDGLIGTHVFDNENQIMSDLPKGLNQQTLEQVTSFLKKETGALSSEEVADGIGMARVTARRYLDYLEKTGIVMINIRYGGLGRPVHRYQIR